MATTPSVEVDFLLRQFDITEYESHHAFMRAFLLNALSTTNKSCDSILYEVQVVNKSIYELLSKAAIRNQFKAEHSLET